MDDAKRDLGIIRRILSYCVEIEETVRQRCGIDVEEALPLAIVLDVDRLAR
ncbi:MAG: hypothetical protein ACM3WU_02990 [Bacillota bacterium]